MIGALLLAAAPALPAHFPKGTSASIEQVRADPRRWHGQWVQFEGWMHRCSALDCVVAERPRNQGMTLSFAGVESFDKWIRPLLPAKVVVVARVNSDCLINLCTDRAPVLNDPFVMTLRWNVADPDKEQ
jgi:hypothetical protein